MNAHELWESHTFHTLLADLFKARKDSELGPMRLQVILDWVGKQGNAALALTVPNLSEPPAKASVSQQLAARPITDEERAAVKLATPDQLPDPVKQLEEVSQIIVASINKDGWDAEGNRAVLISSKRHFDHNYLQSYLKQKHGLQFSSLTVGLDAIQTGTTAAGINGSASKSWRITLSR